MDITASERFLILVGLLEVNFGKVGFEFKSIGACLVILVLGLQDFLEIHGLLI